MRTLREGVEQECNGAVPQDGEEGCEALGAEERSFLGYREFGAMSLQQYGGPTVFVRKHAVLSAELLVLNANLSRMTIPCTPQNPLSCLLTHIYTYIIPSLPTIHIRYPNTIHHAYANTNSLTLTEQESSQPQRRQWLH
jgi:hypothetical protein